jgi:hypothetical protein
LYRCPEENNENCLKVGDCDLNFNQILDLYSERESPFVIIQCEENELLMSHVITFPGRKSTLFLLVVWPGDATARAVNTSWFGSNQTMFVQTAHLFHCCSLALTSAK